MCILYFMFSYIYLYCFVGILSNDCLFHDSLLVPHHAMKFQMILFNVLLQYDMTYGCFIWQTTKIDFLGGILHWHFQRHLFWKWSIFVCHTKTFSQRYYGGDTEYRYIFTFIEFISLFFFCNIDLFCFVVWYFVCFK